MNMRHLFGFCVGLLAGTFAQAGDSSAALQERVQGEIAAYQPAWLPPRDELRGLVVVIDAAREGTPASRREDELSLLTAEHVYHLFRMSGAITLMTRSEDRPAADIEAATATQPGGGRSAGRAHLKVRIVYSTAKPDPASAESSATALCTAIRHNVAGAVVNAPRADGGAATVRPTAVVTFPLPPADTLISDRLAYRKNAQALYKGVGEFWKANASRLLAARTGESDDAAASTQPVPLYPRESKGTKVSRAARQLWPFGSLPLDKAPWLCEIYRRSLLSDYTVTYFEPQVSVENETVVLRGGSTYPQLATGLLNVLKALGVNSIRNEIRLLPEAGGFGQQRFGACVAPMAHTFKLPTSTSGPQTQLLYGEPVFLLDRQSGYLLVQASEGYWGWVREDSIRPMAREEFESYIDGEHAILRRPVETPAGLIRRGSRLRVVSKDIAGLTFTLPDGGRLHLPAGDVTLIEDTSRVAPRVNAALDTLYIPYLFGARSPIGLDCSGLVGTVGELAGMAMARDAAQQCLSGNLVATRWYREGLRAGDQIYFIDELGKVFHTGLMISPTHFVHCSPPEVQISTFIPGERLYNKHWEETFFVAKRP